MFDHYFFVVNTSLENEGLREQIDQLSREKNELLERIKEQERVARLIQTEELPEKKIVIARVTGRDATQWSNVVFINKGKNDGVQENLAVVTNAGVIGHIIQSAGGTSKVLLITDSRSAVDSLFQGSRFTGVIVGTGENVAEMKYVPMNAEVAVGDIVLSSGLGGTFPKGLKIGIVSQAVKKKARVVPGYPGHPQRRLYPHGRSYGSHALNYLLQCFFLSSSSLSWFYFPLRPPF